MINAAKMNLLLLGFLSCYAHSPEHRAKDRAKDRDEENDDTDGERREAGQQEYEAALHLVRAHGDDCADHRNTKEYEPEAENPKSDETDCDADPTCRYR